MTVPAGARQPAAASPSPATAAAPAGPVRVKLERAELAAILFSLSGVMPDRHYVAARSAYQKVEKALQEVDHG